MNWDQPLFGPPAPGAYSANAQGTIKATLNWDGQGQAAPEFVWLTVAPNASFGGESGSANNGWGDSVVVQNYSGSSYSKRYIKKEVDNGVIEFEFSMSANGNSPLNSTNYAKAICNLVVELVEDPILFQRLDSGVMKVGETPGELILPTTYSGIDEFWTENRQQFKLSINPAYMGSFIKWNTTPDVFGQMRSGYWHGESDWLFPNVTQMPINYGEALAPRFESEIEFAPFSVDVRKIPHSPGDKNFKLELHRKHENEMFGPKFVHRDFHKLSNLSTQVPRNGGINVTISEAIAFQINSQWTTSASMQTGISLPAHNGWFANATIGGSFSQGSSVTLTQGAVLNYTVLLRADQEPGFYFPAVVLKRHAHEVISNSWNRKGQNFPGTINYWFPYSDSTLSLELVPDEF